MTTRLTLFLTLGVLGTACGARPTGTDRHDQVPSALTDLETASEHAYDRALARDQAAVITSSDRLLEDWTRLRGEAHGRGVASDVLSELDDAVVALGDLARSSTDPVATARAANRITGSMDELFAVYGPGVPSDVMELDYLGRELALDGLSADLRRAGTHLSLLDDRWAEVRPEVERVGHADDVAKLAAAVDATRAAVASRDAETITTRANALVDRVYDVESVFR